MFKIPRRAPFLPDISQAGHALRALRINYVMFKGAEQLCLRLRIKPGLKTLNHSWFSNKHVFFSDLGESPRVSHLLYVRLIRGLMFLRCVQFLLLLSGTGPLTCGAVDRCFSYYSLLFISCPLQHYKYANFISLIYFTVNVMSS